MMIKKLISSIFKILVLVSFGLAQANAQTTTAGILPLAKTQFLDQNGNPLSSGKVYFYNPGTTVSKTTWSDINKTTPNTNPVNLDAGGRAIVWGDGSYRQQVYDRSNNLIWDQTTAITGSLSGGGIGDGLPVGFVSPWAGLVAPANWQFTYGQTLSRAIYPDLLASLTISESITCVGGNPTITSISDTSSLSVGTALEASCVTGSPTILSKTSSTVTLNGNATISITTNGVFYPYGDGDGSTTFNVPNYRGSTLIGRCNMGGVDCSNLNSTYFSSNSNNTPSSLNAIGGSQSKTLLVVNLPPYTPAGSVSVNSTINNIISGSPTTTLTSGGAGAQFIGVTNGTSASTGITSTGVLTGTAQGGISTPISEIPPSVTTNYIIKVTPNANIGIATIGQLQGGVPNKLTGTDGSGIFGNVNLPTGLTLASSNLNFLAQSCAGSTWLKSIDLNGTFICTQPAFSDLSGSIAIGQIANNLITNAKLATAGANTLKGNGTGSSGNITDISLPSCSGASQAINWTSGSGPGCVTITPNSTQIVVPQNASGSVATTTGTISASSSTLTLASTIDFANNQGIRIDHAGSAFILNAPTALTLSQVGVAGGTTYTYTIAALDANYGVGQSIANVNTATGNASLSSSNYNHLSWVASTGTTPTAYAVYGNHSGSLALIGYTYTTTFDDIGSGAITTPTWLPAAPQTGASLADALITTISSGAGTTTLTLAASATTTATTQNVLHDDTASLQAAITSGSGKDVYIPAGTYRVSSILTSSAGIQISGAGFSGDQAGGFTPNNHSVSSCSSLTGTVICSDVLFDVFDAITNGSVKLSSFQITYPIRPLDNTSGILIKSSTPAGPAGNSQSIIRDVMVTGHCIGVNLQNVLDSVIDSNKVLYGYCGGININAPNFASFTQNKVVNNEVWGNGSTSAVTNKYAYHIQLQAGGDLSVIGNKLNAGGPNTNGISLLSQASGAQNMEPMIISANSIEGAQNCIAVNSNNNSFTTTALTISGNQMWCGARTILFNSNGALKYNQAVTIVGNTLMINGGTALLNMLLDGVSNANISGNTFSQGSACTASTAIQLGANTTGVVVQNNAYDPTCYTTKVVDGGTGNIIGDGTVAWTPSDTSGASLTFSGVSAGYTRIGNMVYAYAQLTYPATGSGSTATIGSLPVSFPTGVNYGRQCSVTYPGTGAVQGFLPSAGTTNMSLTNASGSTVTNATVSGSTIIFNCVYPAS